MLAVLAPSLLEHGCHFGQSHECALRWHPVGLLCLQEVLKSYLSFLIVVALELHYHSREVARCFALEPHQYHALDFAESPLSQIVLENDGSYQLDLGTW